MDCAKGATVPVLVNAGAGMGGVGAVAGTAVEENSLSVMAGSEPPGSGLNTDTLDSVRAACL